MNGRPLLSRELAQTTRRSVISLTTDFGSRDWFVGTMKGVILGINPEANPIDNTHDLPAGDIRAGAFALAASYRFFPFGTVHVVVVDPGVGSQRRAIAVQTARYFFVGPDNGVLSWALRRQRIKAVCTLENEKYFLQEVSRTFHGRDIFAPIAAHLSLGVSLNELGPRLEEFSRIDWPAPRLRRNSMEGEIVYVDHFGNAITNLEPSGIARARGQQTAVWLGGKPLCGLGSFYQSVPQGAPLALAGSSGFLEITINGGSAANAFGLRVGDPVVLKWS